MAMTLNNISGKKGAKRKKVRVGRGLAKKGTTAGRGTKGQRSRSGGKSGLALKGLRQTLLRVPKKRGFKSGAIQPTALNLSDLKDLTLKVVTPKALKEAGLIKATRGGVKILANGDGVALKFKGCKVSKAAQAKIEKAGGSIEA